jgi:hypothetical protein
VVDCVDELAAEVGSLATCRLTLGRSLEGGLTQTGLFQFGTVPLCLLRSEINN